MITIAEPAHFGATHIQVNSAFVALIAQHYPNEKLRVWAEEEHAQLLHAKLHFCSNIAFKKFRKYNSSGTFFWPRKIFGECLQVLKILHNVNSKKGNVVYWLSLFPTGHFLLYILTRYFYKNSTHIVVLHGELEYLSRNRNLAEHVLKKLLQKPLCATVSKLKYIVLGKNIKDALVSLFPNAKENIAVVQHPFFYDSLPEQSSLKYPIRIVTFGALNKSKNTQLFFELAKSFSKEIMTGKIIFSTIGKLNNDIESFKNEWVKCYKPTLFIDHSELMEQLSQNDLAVFFYDNDNYRFTASGALHESINKCIPFLTLKNDYFKTVCDDNAMGLITANTKEMELFIRKILLQDFADVYRYRKEIIRFVQQNSFLLQYQNFNIAIGQLFSSGKNNAND